jgi:hypothetical protein
MADMREAHARMHLWGDSPSMNYADYTIESLRAEIDKLRPQRLDSIIRGCSARAEKSGMAHLVLLRRAIHVLAAKKLALPESWPGRRFIAYCDAVIKYTNLVVTAMSEGEFTARDPAIGAPTKIAYRLQFFMSLQFLRAVMPTLFPHEERLELMRRPAKERLFAAVDALRNDVWLQDLHYRSELVHPDEFSDWAVGKGLAAPGEVVALLSEAARLIDPTPRDVDVEATADSKENVWKVRAKELATTYCLEKANDGDAHPSIERIATHVAGKLRLRGFNKKNGEARSWKTVKKHGLAGWERPRP